ncbi:hypothetical protein [Pedobacter cryophilus]|uniref:Outer membrane protein beta-barrel domain-containing protein n=1 Tax=Pedobacter cryophilus TaxID=2571271 RepID=A0A4U1CAW9_9SPHI|nr:hypothetical protein [Pedobacter cryophilus]TKC00848.1 hypothetical protein FA046_04005 [Pedobacter cryophilus]
MKKLIYLSILFVFLGFLNASAQDKIYKTNGEVIEAKVTEVGATEVKYKVFANLNGPVYTLTKQQIIKVVYEGGKVETYEVIQEASLPKAEEKRAQNVFVEFLGQGLLFTANYDTRFSNKRNGIGGRIGIGAIGGDGDTFVSIPVSLNYLLGEGKNLFEIGVGATYASISGNSDSIFSEGGDTVIGTMSFMYRLQPVKSGFSFRGGFTPIFTSEGFIPYYAGLSLGYTF